MSLTELQRKEKQTSGEENEICLRSRSEFRKKKTKSLVIRSFAGIFAFGEDTHSLRLKSELFDLRSGYANPAPLALWFGILYSTAKGKKNDHPMVVVFLCIKAMKKIFLSFLNKVSNSDVVSG